MDAFKRVLAETVLREVGDLLNIPPFPYKLAPYPVAQQGANGEMYSIDMGNGNKGVVGVEWAPYEMFLASFNHFDVPVNITPEIQALVQNRNIFNIGFAVNGDSDQSYKSDQTELLRLLKTIKDIVVDIINRRKPKVIMVSTEGKTMKNMTGNWTDSKKLRIFKGVIEKQLMSFPGWKMVNAGGATFMYDASIEKH